MTDPNFSAAHCLSRAVRFLVDNRRDLVLIATPPVIGLSVLNALVRLAVPEIDQFQPGQPPPVDGQVALAMVGLSLLNLAFYVMFAVAWHRNALLGEQATVAAALGWRSEKTRFLLLLLLVMLASFVIVAFVGTILTTFAMNSLPLALLAMVVTLGLWLVLMGRWTLVLPAAAVGNRGFGLGDAWRATKGHVLGMVAILLAPTVVAVLLIIPVMLVGMGVSFAGFAGSMTGYVLLSLIGTAANYLAIAFAVSSLSMAYKDLVTAAPRTPDS